MIRLAAVMAVLTLTGAAEARPVSSALCAEWLDGYYHAYIEGDACPDEYGDACDGWFGRLQTSCEALVKATYLPRRSPAMSCEAARDAAEYGDSPWGNVLVIQEGESCYVRPVGTAWTYETARAAARQCPSMGYPVGWAEQVESDVWVPVCGTGEEEP